MKKICLLIPCYNEGLTVRKVVEDFRRELPSLEIYVYDNNSSDDTVQEATDAGAEVRSERAQGKGNVVRRMFREVDADYYVMVDGDDTYPADHVKLLLEAVTSGEADMAIGDRLTDGSYYRENRRRLHGWGNNLVRDVINRVFGSRLKDIMSGYRVFTRDFVKTFPAGSNGFQVETEMTVFALNNRFRIAEIPIKFSERPEGSFSKLDTFSDGAKVLMTIFNLYRHYRPLAFFSAIALLLVAVSLVVGIPPIMEYIEFDYVYKVPSAILASGVFITAVLVFVCGLILDTIAHNEKARFEQTLKSR